MQLYFFFSRKKKNIYINYQRNYVYEIECRKTTLPKIVKSRHTIFFVMLLFDSRIEASNSFRKLKNRNATGESLNLDDLI